MIPIPFNVLGRDPLLGDVSAFRVQITPADIAASTAFHAFNLTASSGCKIYWGDSSYTNYSASGLYSHNYSSAGTYLIQIKGSHSTFNHYSATSNTTPTKVIQAIKLYSGLTSCESMFRGCNNSIFTVRYGFKIGNLVTNCSNMFNFCNGSAFTLPSGFTIPNSVANCYQMFNACRGSSFTLPSGFALVSGALWNTNSMFASCSGNAFNLPSGFTIPNSVTNCAYMFYDCRGTSFTLPNGFTLGSGVKNCSYMFNRCLGNAFNLPSGFTIPNGVTDCSNMFNTCSGSSFTLPSGFAIPVKVTNCSYLLYECFKLTSDISNIFPTWGTVSVNISNAFSGCGLITGSAPATKLWDNTNVTWTSAGAFTNCTALNNYASIPAGWK